MLLDLLSQIEPDDSWRGSYPDWCPRPLGRSTDAFVSTFVDVVDPVGNGPSDSGVIVGRLVQYQSIANVFPASLVTTPSQPYWQPEIPIRRPSGAQAPFSSIFSNIGTPEQPYTQPEFAVLRMLRPY